MKWFESLEENKYYHDQEQYELEQYDAWTQKQTHTAQMKRFWDRIDFGLIGVVEDMKDFKETDPEGFKEHHEEWSFMIGKNEQPKYLFYTR